MASTTYTVTVDDGEYIFSPPLPADGVKVGDKFLFTVAASVFKSGVLTTPFTPPDNPLVAGNTYTLTDGQVGVYVITAPPGSRDTMKGTIKVNN